MKTKILTVIILLLCIGVASAQISSTQQISVSLLNQDPDPVEPGRYVELRFKVENLGGTRAPNVIFEILPEFPFSLDPGQSAQLKIGDINARQTGDNAYILYYKLRIDTNAVEGDNTIRLQYSLDKGQTWILLPRFTVRLKTGEVLLSVESVTTIPERVTPGGEIDLTVMFKNLENSLIKNIKVNLQLIKLLQTTTSISYEELPFSPIDSSNEKIIQTLDGKEEAAVTFNLIVDPDADAGVYKVPAMITYSNDFGDNFSLASVFSVVIAETPSLLVTVDRSEIHYPGETGTITLKFVNKGTSDIKFLYVELKDSDNYEILNSNDEYIGKIESDDYETAEFEIHLLKGGNGFFVVPLHLTYNDAINKEYEEDLDLKVKLYSKAEAKNLGLKKKSNVTGIIIVIVIVGVGLFLYRRWRKKSKQR